MISADGWLDWAIRLQPTKPPSKHLNPGVNPVKGAFFHSAEGYASVLLDPNSQWGYNGTYSYHGSNLFDGRFYQHYPFTARCHHATAANNDYIGIENEGDYPKEPTLTQPQTENLIRLTRDLEDWKGWKGTRTGDKTQTLWEHREVVWLGGEGTSCPSGRIPWDKILAGLQEDDMANLTPDGAFKIVEEHGCMVFYVKGIPVLSIGDESGGPYSGQIKKNFGGTWVYLANAGDPDGDGRGEAFWTKEPRD